MADIETTLRKLLHKIAKEQEYQDYELQVTPISTEGANFSSFLYVGKVISGTRHDLDLYIKVAAITTKIRAQVEIKIFTTEKFFYTEMSKIYAKIEEKHKVPQTHRLRIAKYYGSNTTPPHEMLVLENLAVQGFELQDRFESIDWHYASTATNELAKLHSLSMVYQREYPEKFEYFLQHHNYEWLNENTVDAFWRTGFRKAVEVVKEENKEKLKKMLDQYDVEKVKRQYDPIRCKVLMHVDFRPSNLLHRTRADGSIEIVVVDYQTIQVGSPVNDLLYLIFSGTDKEFRAKYYDKLIDYYYTQLSEAMKRLHIDPETTYSRADFDFELKEKLPFGLTAAAFLLPIVTVEAEDAPKLTSDMDLSSFNVQNTSSVYSERINGVVDDFVTWGILKD